MPSHAVHTPFSSLSEAVPSYPVRVTDLLIASGERCVTCGHPVRAWQERVTARGAVTHRKCAGASVAVEPVRASQAITAAIRELRRRPASR